MKKRVFALLLSLIMTVSILPLDGDAAEPRQEKEGIEQAAVTPYVLNPENEIDNLEELSAGIAARNSRVTMLDYGFPKYFWVNNFGQDPAQDYLEWTVESRQEETESYYVWLHLNAGKGTNFKLEVIQGGHVTETLYTKGGNGWEVTEFGDIQIPPGISQIKFTKISTDKNACSIKGIDMIRKSEKEAYEQRISQYLEDGSQAKVKFSESGYGLFFQAGVWGYPQFGNKKDKEAATNDFDVESFVDTVETTGSKFIIWSLTWWQYRMQMPVSAVDEILGHNQFTTQRNLVGEIAEECKSRGIDFYLYYHQGLQQEPEWKAQQNFPADFSKTGSGDRTLFFDNWIRVITEVGENLGTNLDGWFFDDGCVYYPAPFERMAQATKAGNTNRIVAYNSWQGTAITKFEDMIFGEGGWGDKADTVDGIYQSGKEKGLLQVGMPMINNGNWGITSANETIVPQVTASSLISKIESAKSRKVPMALNIKMWEDGRIGDGNLQLLFDTRDGLNGQAAQEWVNDDDSQIKYSSNWNYGTNYSESINGDVHYNKKVDGTPTVEYTFRGTGISVIGRAETWACDIKVYLDGKEDTREDWTFTSSKNIPQYEVYRITGLEDTQHTIRVEYISGSEAQFDAFKIMHHQPEKPEYPVKSITISNSGGTNSIGTGEVCQLKADIRPEYATNKKVLWSVTDESGEPTELASIDKEGNLTAGTKLGTIKVSAVSAQDETIIASKVFSIELKPLRTTVYGNSDVIDKAGSWTVRGASKSCDSKTMKDTAEFTFQGDYIEWYGVKAEDHGIADIYIDNTYITNVDCYSSGRETDTLLFRSEKLGEGTHQIKIEVNELRNQDSISNYIEIYRFVTEQAQKLDTKISLEDKTAVYMGIPVEMTGAVTDPEGLPVIYQYRRQGAEEWSGNAPIDAGTYEVKAVFEGNESYHSSEAQALLVIEKQTSKVTLQDKTQPYTGQPIPINEAITYPEGLSVSYEYRLQDNGAWSADIPTEAGSYEVRAVFAGDANYSGSEAQAVLVIEQQETKVSLNDKTATYTGSPVIMAGAVTTPDGLSVTYQYKLKEANEWSNNAPSQPGIYEVKALFAGNNNYLPSEAQALLTINKSTEKPEEMQRFEISVQPLTKGNIQLVKNQAAKGDIIRVSVTPDKGYRLKAKSLKYNGIELTYKDGAYSFVMPGQSVTITAEFQVIVPSKVKAKATGNTASTIKITYNKSEGAAGYEIYSKAKSAKKWSKVKTTRRSWVGKGLKAGQIYQFKVRGYHQVNSKVVYGDYSDIITTATAPKKPSINADQAGKGKVKVSWKKGTFSDGFVVERKEGNGKYKKVKTVQSKSSVGTVISGLKKGKTYTFRVKGYKKVSKSLKVYGSYSSVSKIKI